MPTPLNTPNAPAAIGPYSQAMRTGNLLFLSGQIPIVPDSGEIEAQDISEQTHQVMHNIEAILKAAGLGFEDVVKTTCFLSNIADFAAFNAVYARYFTGKPARSCFAVAALPKNARVEVEVIAQIKE